MNWTVVLGFEAQRELWAFCWDRTNEVAGAVFGRFETSGINRRDTGRHLFVRRVIQSDHGGTPEAVSLDYDSVYRLQTFPVPSRPGSSRGRTGGRRLRRLDRHDPLAPRNRPSARAVRHRHSDSGGERAQRSPALGLGGRPFLSMLATAGEAWSEGMPDEDWANPVIDYHLVFSDRSIIRPRISVMSELEWLVEEGQRELSATANERGN